jgi:hypothetical protein
MGKETQKKSYLGFKIKINYRSGMVAHTYNQNYLGYRRRTIVSLRPAQAKLVTPY